MIDPSTLFGKVLMVFFWGTLSAEVVTVFNFFIPIPVIVLPFSVVGVNMLLVFLKNKFFK